MVPKAQLLKNNRFGKNTGWVGPPSSSSTFASTPFRNKSHLQTGRTEENKLDVDLQAKILHT